MSNDTSSQTISFRIVPSLPGSHPLFGLPDIEMFAFRLTPIVVLGLAVLTLGFGIRGLFAGAILYYIWASNPPTATGRNAANGGHQPGSQSIFGQIQAGLGLGQLGSGNQAAGTAGRGSLGGSGNDEGGQLFRGHGNRLGGNAPN